MMLKITERCTMGCKHCMNRATSDGKDMSEKVFMDSLNFLRDNHLGFNLVITGGESTECDSFDKYMNTLTDFHGDFKCFPVVVVTTNGEIIQNDPERFLGYLERAIEVGMNLSFQVSADVRYYPRRIQTHKRIFREDGMVLCDNCVEQIYPQGRALDNNIPWKSRCSKCFNVRAISKQLPEKARLEDIVRLLASHGKFCTPHISISGDIKLGESDLCPKCTSIYDTQEDIMKSIREFKCHQCDMVNDKLADVYKELL